MSQNNLSSIRSWRLMCLTAALFLLSPMPSQATTLDAALLADMIPDEGSAQCADPGTTSTTFTFPGTNSDSEWWSSFLSYESGLFLAEMHHEDTVHGGRRTWTVRVGEGGNIYSHYAPNLFGEAIPPQAHSQAPWIDEVLQTVSVDRARNFQAPYENNAYYIHQAGAYQRDGSYTSTPFYSPNVAKHCSGNTCTFASWGQHAHVPTPFTSPILYIHRYRNCGEGVIEYTQTIHNFADPATTTPEQAVHDYFNTAWGGVRVSSLPYPLEPGLDRSLSYADPSSVDHAPACKWGSAVERDNIRQLNQLGGYTTFAGPGLKVGNRPTPNINIPCRKPLGSGGDCYANQGSCMVDSCTDDQIATEGYTRLVFKVPAGGVNCNRHDMYNGKVCLQCNIIEQGFGRNNNGFWPCDSDGIMFKNPATNETLRVLHVRHWSWNADNHLAYFSVDHPDTTDGLNAARTEVAAKFPPGSTIEVIPYTVDATPDPSYDPHSIPAYTYVMGQGSEYLSGGNIGTGQGRRRVGNGARNFYVWTINHINSLYAGDTYVTRQFLVASELGNVTNIANPLVDETFMDKVSQNEHTGRSIEIYTNALAEPGVFGVSVADTVGGSTTSCAQGTATCVGRSAPAPGYQPFFYQTCAASSTYAGPYPYWFSSGFDQLSNTFSNPVRSYHCAGQGESVRPTWKLLGFFPTGDAGCNALSSSYSYDETFCDRTAAPTPAPSPTPSAAPTQCSQPTDCVSESGCCVGSCHDNIFGDLTCHFECGCDGPGETCVENICVTSSPSSGPSSSPSVTGSSSPSISASASPSSSPTSSEGLGTCSNNGAVCSETANCNCPTTRRLRVAERDLQTCQGPGEACGGRNKCCSGSQCVNVEGQKGQKECSAPLTNAPTSSPPTSSAPSALPTSAPVLSPPTSDAPTPGPVCECVFPSESPSSSPSATPTKYPTSAPTMLPTTSSPTVAQTCIIRGDPCSGSEDTNCCGSDTCSLKGRSYKCSK